MGAAFVVGVILSVNSHGLVVLGHTVGSGMSLVGPITLLEPRNFCLIRAGYLVNNAPKSSVCHTPLDPIFSLMSNWRAFYQPQ